MNQSIFPPEEGKAESKGGYVSVKAGTLEGIESDVITKKATHIWTKRALVAIPEGVESFEEEPPPGQ
jgi:hypothetical protein